MNFLKAFGDVVTGIVKSVLGIEKSSSPAMIQRLADPTPPIVQDVVDKVKEQVAPQLPGEVAYSLKRRRGKGGLKIADAGIGTFLS
mgnify:CR=1 FL=1